MLYYKTVFFGSLCLLGLGTIMGFFGFPIFLKNKIESEFNLKEGSESRKSWEQLPIPIDFKVYVFNITNPTNVQNGEKVILEEIGPFVFDEWKDKYDIEDNEENDTVSFNMRNTFTFNQEKSYPLTGEEVITMPHPLIQMTAISIKRGNEPMLPFISKALMDVFNQTSPFITASFMDIFFRGIPVNCGVKSNEAKAFCSSFNSGTIKGSSRINDTFFAFGLLAGGNSTDGGRFTVKRGINESEDLGQVVCFNGEEKLTVWSEDPPTCNMISGTDSTIFSTFRTEQEGVTVFSAELCQSLKLDFEEKRHFNGVKVSKFSSDFGNIKNDRTKHCFCKDAPIDCPLKGTLDLHSCVKQPMIASSPHFYNGDRRLFENIIGLSPNETRHKTFMDFEMITGSPLNMAKRIQFNLDVEPIDTLDVMKNLSRMVMPMFWVEEQLAVPTAITDKIKGSLYLVIKINNTFKWISVVVGMAGLCVFAFLNYTKKDVEEVVTVSPKQRPRSRH
ncbi:Snmp1 family protein [Megaselia abdita]